MIGRDRTAEIANPATPDVPGPRRESGALLRRFPTEFWLLVAAALVSRLWSLKSPPDLVWDERHYVYFIGSFLNGSWMMDVHPPLGRLLLALVAWVEGYGRDLIGQQAGAPAVRILPALAGAALVPAAWAIVRAIGGGRVAAAIAATAILADTALLAESRIFVPDTLLLLAILAAVGAVLGLERAQTSKGRLLWLLMAALAAGAAVSIKWTGLAAAGLVAGRLAYAAWRRRIPRREASLHGVVALVVVLAVYLASFAVQLHLLRVSGREDWWMSPAFTRTLEGTFNHEHGSSMPFLAAVSEIHHVMVRMNASIAEQGGGTSASAWFTWPISKHGITMLSVRSDQPDGQRWMVMTGNPVVWWGALLGMLLAAAGVVAAHMRRWHEAAWAVDFRAAREAIAFLALAYVANFAPFALINRPMYLYHYFAALLFSIMLAAIGVELLTRHLGRAGTPIRVGWIALVLASGAYLAPIACGWPLSADAVRHRFVLIERRGAD